MSIALNTMAPRAVVATKRKDRCSVCESRNLKQVLDLPGFPLTGVYLDAPAEKGKYEGIDQGLMLCLECGHAQLLVVVDPTYLYLDTYSHRSSISAIATSGNDFFAAFLEQLTPGQTFQRVVEVGCNDGYLLGKIEHKGKAFVGIDPIWKGRESEYSGKIKVIGKFAEEVDLASELKGAPDLILSVHTMEHLSDPKDPLMRLMHSAQEGALFIVEVPGFDSLLVNCRFDQVFHQHIQYFSLASFRRMIRSIGGEYLAHTFNDDYWGGTLLVAFRKGRSGTSSSGDHPVPSQKQILARWQIFQEQLAHLTKVIADLDHEPIYGYGAAQMLPTLAYHMKSDLSFLECVLDDNPARDNLTYPHLSVWIRKPPEGMTLEGAGVLITALDSLRPILKRVLSMRPRRVYVPLNLF